MRNYLSLFLFFILANFCRQAWSQKDVEVFYEKNYNGSYTFYAENNHYCSYALEIKFTKLENYKDVSSTYKRDIGPGRNSLFTLQPQDPGKPSNFNYNYKCIKGCINPKINPEFVYLLPVGAGKSTEARPLKYLQMNDKDPEPKDYYGLAFKISAGDTIYAARRGIVNSVRDTTNLTLSGYNYSSSENFIEIFHEDCSFGWYGVIDKSLVKEGGDVEAGDPIAIAGGEKYTIGPHVRFQVYYNFEQKFDIKQNDGTNVKKYWAYVPLVFHTQEGNEMLIMNKEYVCEKPESVITQEMSKRELKNWNKKKSK